MKEEPLFYLSPKDHGGLRLVYSDRDEGRKNVGSWTHNSPPFTTSTQYKVLENAFNNSENETEILDILQTFEPSWQKRREQPQFVQASITDPTVAIEDRTKLMALASDFFANLAHCDISEGIPSVGVWKENQLERSLRPDYYYMQPILSPELSFPNEFEEAIFHFLTQTAFEQVELYDIEWWSASEDLSEYGLTKIGTISPAPSGNIA